MHVWVSVEVLDIAVYFSVKTVVVSFVSSHINALLLIDSPNSTANE